MGAVERKDETALHFGIDEALLPLLLERIGSRKSKRGKVRKVTRPFPKENLEEALLGWARLLVQFERSRKVSLENAEFRNSYERRTGQQGARTYVMGQWGEVEVSTTPDPSPEVEVARLAGQLPRPGATTGKGLEPVSHRWARAAMDHFDNHEMAIAWGLARGRVPAKGPAAREAALKAISALIAAAKE